MKPIIQVEGLSKAYVISHQRRASYGSLRDELAGLFKRSSEPHLTRGSREKIWALDDVNFSVNQGEIVGIIGKNGSGKSTLLKILSRIVEPTRGQAILRGKVASLLEVGTGFHPELTGRENVYLNGAILGMSRREIRLKFDEIVEFSGVEKFLDTPVKFFSSGMHVRLAFAVAAHLEPDVLIVDEVLSVGDVEFQRKSLGKMGEVAGEGRTVLFVSHNMASVNSLCTRVLALEEGRIKKDGGPLEVVRNYLRRQERGEFTRLRPESEGEHEVRVKKISLRDLQGRLKDSFDYAESITMVLQLDSPSEKLKKVRVDVNIFDEDGGYVKCFSSFGNEKDTSGRQLTLRVAPGLAPGRYTANIALLTNYSTLQQLIPSALGFEVVATGDSVPGVSNIGLEALDLQ
jgi:lipopolysaccharide transport system ATP-binding protein